VKEVRLSTTPPRPLAEITSRINLRRGLRAGYGFGALFLIGGVLGGLFPVLSGAPWNAMMLFQMIVVPLFFGRFAMLFLIPARRRYRARVDAFVNGQLVDAKVTGRARAWVPYSSARDHLIRLIAELDDGRTVSGAIRSRTDKVGAGLQSGDLVQALLVAETATLFAPLEIGVDVVAD